MPQVGHAIHEDSPDKVKFYSFIFSAGFSLSTGNHLSGSFPWSLINSQNVEMYYKLFDAFLPYNASFFADPGPVFLLNADVDLGSSFFFYLCPDPGSHSVFKFL